MKTVQKTILIMLAATLLIGLLMAVADGTSFVQSYAITCLLASLPALVIGIIVVFTKAKEIGKGLLLSAGILFLIGFATCTASFSLH